MPNIFKWFTAQIWRYSENVRTYIQDGWMENSLSTVRYGSIEPIVSLTS